MMGKATIALLLWVPMVLNAEPRPGTVPAMTLDEVRDRMIEESVKAHPDCPCPYSPDHIGGECGTECHYYRPGGYHLKCFEKDISTREIHFYKLKYATPGTGY